MQLNLEDERMFNSDMTLYFLANYIARGGQFPDPMIAPNVSTDYNNLVYHREQFEQDGLLSAEYVVADYRFTQQELTDILEQYEFKILDSRFVRAGHFDEPLAESDGKAKEILFIIEKE